MKRILALAALGVAFASAAHAESTADTSSQSVPISGTVTNLCVLGTPSSASVDLGTIVQTSGASVGKLVTGLAPSAITLPGSFCNFAGSAVTVSATALTTSAAAQTSFSSAVNFTATASGWNGSTVATTAAGADKSSPTTTTTGSTQTTPKQADISLALTAFTAPGSNLLTAGGYSGSVTITLAPAAAPPT